MREMARVPSGSTRADEELGSICRTALARGALEPCAASRGSAVKKNTYQGVICRGGVAFGFKATPHALRATFACMLLARLEQLATQGAAINPLLIVKVLMAHEHIDTTDRYLRAISVDSCSLPEILDSLLGEMN
jgi:integrase/recombinase XerD